MKTSLPLTLCPLFIGLVVIAAPLAGCSKAPQAPQPKTVDLDKQAAAKAAAAEQATPPTATAAAAPVAASPVVAAVPAKAEEPKRQPSIALHLSSARSKEFAMPERGKKARIQVTPVDSLGRPYSELGDFFGGRLLMVTMRSDGSWARILRTTEFSAPDRGKHRFEMTFNRAGAHVMIFAFKPLDGPLVTVPSYINVTGKGGASIALTERELRYVGTGKLEVALVLPEAPIKVCEPVELASSWARKGRPMDLRREGEKGPTVRYAAAHMGLTGLALATPKPDPKGDAKLAAGDVGSHATLRLERPGRHRVIAIARAGKKEQTALFTLNAVGEVPPEGCPAQP